MLDITNSLLLMTALFNAALTFFILKGNRKKPTNIFLGLYLLGLSFWAIALIGSQVGPSYVFWVYCAKLAYIAALLIGASFYLFSITFPEDRKIQKNTILIIYGLAGIYAILLLESNFLVKKIISYQWGNAAILGFPEYILFSLLFCFFYIGGLIRVWFKYFKFEGIAKTQLFIIGVGASITGIGGMYYNLILASPYFNNFHYLWSGPLFNTSLGIVIIYAIFRLHLFNTKVIAVELLISLLWIFTFLRTLLAIATREQVFNGLLFILSLVIGSLLIRSVHKEVQQREKLEILTKELEAANEHLKELDKLKSEFLSFASHQLKSPMAIVKGFATLIYDGTYGKIPVKVKETAARIKESADRLINLVNNFLDLRRLEEGKMEYSFEEVDLVKLVKNITEELQLAAKIKKIHLSFETKNQELKARIDEQKLRQVIYNLIDNAIKYTEAGWVKAEVSEDTEDGAKSALVVISDSGRGISSELLPNLFKQFSRESKTAKAIQGTGLGLFIAQQIVAAHKGKIWAESEGENKGSRFIVKVPKE